MAAYGMKRSRSLNRIINFKYNLLVTESNLLISRHAGVQTRQYSGRKDEIYDMVIVGGGIVGMASAREIALQHSGLKLAVVEKESKLAFHQSGHNSGVVHAGIYYKPGTLKAKLCVEGMKLAYRYCDKKGIPYKKCGKLIVATNCVELKRLRDLEQRGIQNQVPDLRMIPKDEIKDIEPFCQGVKALHSPHTGIVDWALVTHHYGEDFKQAGGHVFLNFQVSKFRESTDADYPVAVVSSTGRTVKAKYVLTCGGLHSDVLSVLSGCSKEPRIVPFRGEYLLLRPNKTHLVRGNIYPVPDPRFPFLGVHFTPRMDGSVWLGPNAIFALGREGYTWTGVNLPELKDTLAHRGFRKLAFKYLSYGAQEMLKSRCLSLQIKDLQKFVPQLQVADVVRGPAGVRAQALDSTGNLVDDFVFDVGTTGIGPRVLHCRNAPSPGATSSLAIAKHIAVKVKDQFQL